MPTQKMTNLDAIQAHLRSRRLIQIASLTIVGLVIIAIRTVQVGNLDSTIVLGLGIATMILCLLLNQRGCTEAANLLLVVSLGVMVSSLMWIGEGLRDSGLLAFPALLISAALLIQPRHFVALAIAMMLVAGAIAASTYLGWRMDRPSGNLINRTVDTTIVLVISSFVVWIMIGDLQRVLRRLRVQVDALSRVAGKPHLRVPARRA